MMDLFGMPSVCEKSAKEDDDKTLLTMPNVLRSNLTRMSSLEALATIGPASAPGAEGSLRINYNALNSNLLGDENSTGADEFLFDCLDFIVVDPPGSEKDGLVNNTQNDASLEKDLNNDHRTTDSSLSRTKAIQPRHADGWSSLGGSVRSLTQMSERTAASPAPNMVKSAPSTEVPNFCHSFGVSGNHPTMYFTHTPTANERQQVSSAETLMYHVPMSQAHAQSLGEGPGISTSTRCPASATGSTSTTSGLQTTSVAFPLPTGANGVPVYFPYPAEAPMGHVASGATLPSAPHASYVPVVAMNPNASPTVLMNGKGPYPQFSLPNDEIFRSNLFVCGLSHEVCDRELIEAFGKYGEIESAKVMLDIHSGQSRGIAFVKFKDVKCAETALAELNGSMLHNSTITVRVANSRAAYIPGAPTNKTFVRNVPLTVSKERLTTYFSQFGDVLDVSVHADTAQGRQNLVDMGNYDPAIHESGPDELRLNIVFVTFTTKEAAAEAAARTHTTSPFPECNGTPLLAKVAEDSARRIKRLARRYRTNHGPNAQPMGELPAVIATELPKGGMLQMPAGVPTGAPLQGVYPTATTALAYPQGYYPSPVPPYQYVIPQQVCDFGQPVMVPLVYMAPPGVPNGVVAPAQAPGPYYVVMDGKSTGPVMMAHAQA